MTAYRLRPSSAMSATERMTKTVLKGFGLEVTTRIAGACHERLGWSRYYLGVSAVQTRWRDEHGCLCLFARIFDTNGKSGTRNRPN
jgi:hypothetical protein